MILVDLNQVLLSGLMAQIASQKGIKLEEGLIRHMILNIIRTHLKNFREEYGEVVLCADNRKYWRKEFFPFNNPEYATSMRSKIGGGSYLIHFNKDLSAAKKIIFELVS